MDISLERPDEFLFVRSVGERSIVVVDRRFDRSILLAPDRVLDTWPVTDANVLRAEHAEAFLALEPELVLLGTGSRQVFPDAAFLASFMRRGVGIEVMDNAAAARTYDLLASEGRRVVAGFILPD